MAANCLPLHSTGLKSRKVEQTGACRSKISAGRSKSNPLRVPPGKIVQAQAMLVEGRSQREIGRTLHISPMTVSRILKAEDFQALVREQRLRIFSHAAKIVDSVIAAAITDPYLGYQLLKDFGVIPERGAGLQNNPKNLATTREEDLEARVIHGMAAVMLERHKIFGIELPDELEAVIEKENK
jgi:predicted transcriptional regulator